jgi:hypothetical protein
MRNGVTISCRIWTHDSTALSISDTSYSKLHSNTQQIFNKMYLIEIFIGIFFTDLDYFWEIFTSWMFCFKIGVSIK